MWNIKEMFGENIWKKTSAIQAWPCFYIQLVFFFIEVFIQTMVVQRLGANESITKYPMYLASL